MDLKSGILTEFLHRNHPSKMLFLLDSLTLDKNNNHIKTAYLSNFDSINGNDKNSQFMPRDLYSVLI